MFELALLFVPIQSFVVTTIIKGMTISNTFVLLIIAKHFLTFRKKAISFALIFSIAYILYFLIAQLSILISPPQYDFSNIIFISNESINHLYFRKSFITQSLYLFVVIMFFYFLLLFLRKYGKDKVLDISFLGIIIFIIYGYFEFFLYQITGKDPDFISNRIAGENFKEGLFQTITVAGVHIQRMKSLAGEPSMFAYILLPFFILSIYIRRTKFMLASFITLILTTSTTAILGLIVYFIFDLIYRKNKIIKLSVSILIFTILFIIFYDIIISLYDIIEVKLTLQNESGIVRFTNILNHFTAWYHSNLINMFFGYGFGYARSTDGFTTLLFNTGILGVVFYTLFFLLPYFLIKRKTQYILGLYISNFVLLIVIFASVPEFYYPHIWLFNALLWYEYLKEKREIKMLRQQHANN